MEEKKNFAEVRFGGRWKKSGSFFAAGSTFLGGSLLDEKLLAELFGHAEPGEFPQILHGCNGFFAAAGISENTIFAAVDRVRSIPVFYAVVREQILLGDDPRWIKNHADFREYDKASGNELLLTRYVTGRDTLVPEIKQLQAGEYLFADRNRPLCDQQLVFRYYNFRHSDADTETAPFHARNNIEFEQMLEEHRTVLSRAFDRFASKASGRPVIIPLSGGYDSRLVAVMLRRVGYDNIRCFSFGKEGNDDSRISKEVADRLGLRWTFVPYSSESMYRAVNSEEWRNYNRMADGLYCSCFDRDWPAVQQLKKDGAIPDNAIFVPGHSGDFIGGGHIREGFLQKPPICAEALADEILDRHYTMWRWNGKREILRPEFYKKIVDCTGAEPLMSPAKAADCYEKWVWQEFQAKYLVNGVRVYEYFGYDWWLPLWDAEYMDFWAGVPLQFRQNKRLYNETVFRLYAEAAGIPMRTARIRNDSKSYTGAESPHLARLFKKMIRASPVRSLAAAVRNRVRAMRPSLPKQETMELDWEQCQGRLNRSLYDALMPYMTNRSSGATLEKLGYIRFTDEKVSDEILKMLNQMRGTA